jgi:hypothetical protein
MPKRGWQFQGCIHDSHETQGAKPLVLADIVRKAPLIDFQILHSDGNFGDPKELRRLPDARGMQLVAVVFGGISQLTPPGGTRGDTVE